MVRHQQSKARMGGQFAKLFETPVNPNGVPDYAEFVPPEKQMWLLKMKARVRLQWPGQIGLVLVCWFAACCTCACQLASPVVLQLGTPAPAQCMADPRLQLSK